jgi:hypothetical protein
MTESVFSLKILFHNLRIDPRPFQASDLSFDDPKLAVKFLNFPTFTIPRKTSANFQIFNQILVNVTLDSATVLGNKANGIDLKAGKSTLFKMPIKDLRELIDFFNLKINLTNFRGE